MRDLGASKVSGSSFLAVSVLGDFFLKRFSSFFLMTLVIFELPLWAAPDKSVAAPEASTVFLMSLPLLAFGVFAIRRKRK